MKPVKSSNISHIGHRDGALVVRFHSGDEWEYPGVPAETHAAMLASESVGKFFHAHIKGKFDGKKRDK